MRFRRSALALVASVLAPPSVATSAPDNGPAASAPASRITVAGELGYAFPLGSGERGTQTGDVSFGLVPLVLAGRYDLGRGWDAGLELQYAANIPTLAGSASDAGASVGRDIRIAASIGRTLPRWRRFTPQVDLTVGWEWLTTKLSDSGVAASRSWNGPTAALELFVDVRSGGPWSLGPVIGADVGVFTHLDLDTPAWHTSGSTATAVHAWPLIAFRLARRL